MLQNFHEKLSDGIFFSKVAVVSIFAKSFIKDVYHGPKYASTLLEKIVPWVFFKEFMNAVLNMPLLY